MKKIDVLNLLYVLSVIILFVINLVMFKKDYFDLLIVLPIICFLALYPLIRKVIVVKHIKSKKYTSKHIYIIYEYLHFLQFQYEKRKRNLEENETQLEQKKQAFEQEKKCTKETVEFIEEELTKMSSDMSGESYERFVGFCLITRGWKIIKYTKRSGDYGADIIALNPEGKRTCIQCKRYNSGNVGIDAIQQVYASQKYYDCSCGTVITNTKFTRSACKLAKKTGVVLLENFPKKTVVDKNVKKSFKK